MPRTIDWLYSRKSCLSCEKASAHRASIGVTVKHSVDARTVRYGPEAALELLTGVSKLVVSRGKAIRVFDLKRDRPDDVTLLAQLIGPTGNLRAPTARLGKTLLVGYNQGVYDEHFG